MQGDGFTDTEQATDLVDAALSAVASLRDGAFWKLFPDQLLGLGRQLEHLSRTLYAAQIHLAGEIDTAALAATRSCPSTAALLRQSLNISAADAIGRVNTARQILPRQQLTGPDAPPLLPTLRGAVDNGQLGAEHVRIIVDTIRKIPPQPPPKPATPANTGWSPSPPYPTRTSPPAPPSPSWNAPTPTATSTTSPPKRKPTWPSAAGTSAPASPPSKDSWTTTASK